MYLEIGCVLNGTYRIERLLGEGAMAQVYVATHTRMPRQFAVKVLSPLLAAQTALVERFRREIDMLARLKHPHIVDVVDCHQTALGQPYLVMELLVGEDLDHFLRRSGRLPRSVALAILSQIGAALAAAHESGVIHRDLKPANIFLCQDGPQQNLVKVLDFGVAKPALTLGPLLTAPSALLGTPAYMSPEQAQGRSDLLDSRSDQFALATIFYEMLSGRPAFARGGDDVQRVLTRVLSENPTPLAEPDLWPALRRALHKDREGRFPSVKHFLADLGAAPADPQRPRPRALTAGEARPGRLTHTAAMSAALLSGGIGVLLGRSACSTRTSSDGHDRGAAADFVAPAMDADQGPSLAALPSSSQPARWTAAAATVARGALPAPASGTQAAPARSDAAPSRTPDPEAAPPSPPSTTPGKRTPPAALKSRPAGPPVVEISGADPEQRALLMRCFRAHLQAATKLPDAYRMVLQRSNVLVVTSAPRAVHDTDFEFCLKEAFTVLRPPREVLMDVQRGRR